MHGVASEGILTDANELGYLPDAPSHAVGNQMNMHAHLHNDRSTDSQIPTDSQAQFSDNEDENGDEYGHSGQPEDLMLRINQSHNPEAIIAMKTDSDIEENMAVKADTNDEVENYMILNRRTQPTRKSPIFKRCIYGLKQTSR